ncbi:MAG: phytanoyl-CoA dioxygenase family protein [Bdellovibrionales bacterium]|nr:phytanoyl-CoA dioxygenase family protein [Bdellovibrionales bacterium]
MPQLSQVKSLKEQFEEDGFVIARGAIPVDLLAHVERQTYSLAKKLLGPTETKGIAECPFETLRTLERTDRDAFATVCGFSGSSLAGFAITTCPGLLGVLREICSREVFDLFPTLFGLFWNDRSTTRLHYDWHQETSYYQGYPESIHTWFPLFRNLKDEDGPMIVCRGSHKEHFSFDTEFIENGLTQLRVRQSIAEQFEQVHCSISRGDVVIFHERCLHSTGTNFSALPRISGIIRYVALLEDRQGFRPHMQRAAGKKMLSDSQQ